MTTPTDATYAVQLSNTPDGDGHYRAGVYRDGALVQSFYRSDRDEALADARAFVTRDRAHDPTDFETVTL